MIDHKTILGIVAAGFSLLPAAPVTAQTCVGQRTAQTVRLEVTATDLRNASGEIAFTVYPDDKSRFLVKGGKLARVRVPAVAPATSACFWLKLGFYAIGQYHDENADHDFNRTLFSIKEGFGFSNDAPTTLGLPSFSGMRFRLPAGGTTVRIHMRYKR